MSAFGEDDMLTGPSKFGALCRAREILLRWTKKIAKLNERTIQNAEKLARPDGWKEPLSAPKVHFLKFAQTNY